MPLEMVKAMLETRDPVSFAAVEALVWSFLADTKGRRPSVEWLGRALGVQALRLQRNLRQHERLLCSALGTAAHVATLREMITAACITYAAKLIAAHTKIDAVRQLSGFGELDKSSFNKAFMSYYGIGPREHQKRCVVAP